MKFFEWNVTRQIKLDDVFLFYQECRAKVFSDEEKSQKWQK